MDLDERFKRNVFFIFVLTYIIYFLVVSLPFGQPVTTFFAPGDYVTGDVVGLVFFEVLDPDACSISMTQGWNLISVCNNVSDHTVLGVFNDTNASIRFVLEWNESAQKFLVFSPQQDTPPFTELNPNKSYFVFLDTASATETVEGNAFEDLNVSLIEGYNTPVYPYNFQSDVAQYLDSIQGQFSFSLKWNTSSQEFIVFSPLSTSPGFNTTSEGEGQFILVSDASGALLQYNKSKLEG